jgi:hypothetical protein
MVADHDLFRSRACSDQPFRDGAGLDTDIGHGGNFPKGTPAHGTYRGDSWIWCSIRGNEPTLRIDFKSKALRVGTRASARDQIRKERSRGLLHIACQSRAIDDPGKAHLFFIQLAAPAPRDKRLLSLQSCCCDLARPDGKTSKPFQRGNSDRNGRGYAMAMNLPPRPEVPQKAASLGVRGFSPKALNMGA